MIHKHIATLPLAVTIGEPAGIGPDVVLDVWNGDQRNTLPPFVLLADPNQLQQRAALLGIEIKLSILTSRDGFEARRDEDEDSLPVLPLAAKLQGSAGRPSAKDATGVIESIDRAVDLVHGGLASGVVTLPISKKTLYDAGFKYPGHTEYLGVLAQRWADSSRTRPVMMLAGPELRTVPVTIHIPLHDVAGELTTNLIVETARITASDLRSRFGIACPRLVISGLNPHAGEDGALGSEDASVILPAVQLLQAEGVDCIGPLPADTMFHAAARARYDAALCMYHDQALIPAKALAFDEAVNVTLGLPFVRTSPDHGTAFDIAGTGQASAASFVAALRMANEMTSHSVAQSVSA